MEGHAPLLIDGVAVVEAVPPGRPRETSFEVYLLPEIADVEPKLSGLSACSSLCAETGAPEIRHLDTPPTVDEDEEECEEEACPSDEKDGVSHIDECEMAGAAEDEPSCPSLPVKTVEHPSGNSFDVFSVASSLTLRESDYFIHPSVFDFCSSLMPEVSPRVVRREQRRELSVLAPMQSRYRRPVDSLLAPKRDAGNNEIKENAAPVAKRCNVMHISPPTPSTYQRPTDPLRNPVTEEDHNKPSPIPKHGSIRQRRRNDAHFHLIALTPTSTPRTTPGPLTPLKVGPAQNHALQNRSKPAEEDGCENFDPQSPTARVQRGRRPRRRMC